MISVHKGVAHPWLCDIMGHMTTRHYVAMFDDASYHFLSQAFGWAPAHGDDFGWADVKHTIEYQDEVGAGELLEIRAGLAKVGGKSITVRYKMHNLTRGNLAATLESVSVYFDLKARKAAPIPDDLRERASTYVIEESD